ncbi:MAG: metallopeptidase TldD-related protein, partial [Streptosporangiaceae bacterium]
MSSQVQAVPSPQEAVERALAAARCDDCVVIADESSSANLRWAGNSLTTNGVSRSRQLTVVAISRSGDEARAGVVSRAGLRADQIADIVAEAEAAAAEASPADDAQPLVAPAANAAAAAGFELPPEATQIGVFSGFAAELGTAFATAASGGRKLYGFAEHQLTSTYLGTSAGLRLRHDQPTGRLELNAKSADLAQSAWAGTGTRDFADVDVTALEADLAQRLDWAKRPVSLPAGRYETLLPPTAVADLLIYLYWSAGAKDALDGRTVFSRPGGGTRIGEELARLPVSLYSDPAEPRLQCAPFVVAHASSRESSVFDNGLPTGRTDWIAAGQLGALTQTRYTARLSGQPVTPAIDNLVMTAPGAAGSVADLV